MRASGGMRDGTVRLHHGTQPVHHFLGVSCFAERAVVVEQALVPIPRDVPLEVAALVGCSVITGFGAVVRSARVSAGESVLVIGAGGVGLNCIMAAQLSGAGRIIAADRNPARLPLAQDFGATDTIDVSQEDLVPAVRRLTGDGVDHAFEVIGNPQTISAALSCIRRGGVATVVGLAPLSATATIRPADLLLQEKTLRGTLYGSAQPHADVPLILDLYRSGKLPLDRLVTRRYPLREINEAYAALIAGEVARSVLVMS
jgi:Zn-dependent alcohol dehydrogenase